MAEGSEQSVSRETSRLAELGARYELDERQIGQLTAVLAELAGDERAPTAVRDPAEALDVHVADSLVALELDAVRAAGTLVDMGVGAGFPGLALAVALPRCEVVLLESQARKCAFVERVLGAAEVANGRAVCARVEEWREGRGEELQAARLRESEDVGRGRTGGSDVVTARALAPQPVVLEYAAPLLRVGGVLVDWRGRRAAGEEAAAGIAAGELGLRLAEIRRVEPYAGVRDHHLHVYEKMAVTPTRYPRRAGVARKRPLGC